VYSTARLGEHGQQLILQFGKLTDWSRSFERLGKYDSANQNPSVDIDGHALDPLQSEAH
jgi:hypothetical protein